MSLRLHSPASLPSLFPPAVGGGDATADGADLSFTWSLGAGEGGAATPADALDFDWSLAAGTGSAATPAAALSFTWSLSAGAAGASTPAAALGFAWSLSAGTAPGGAPGASLGFTWSLSAGTASASTPAAALGLAWSLDPGTASDSAGIAPGAALSFAWSLSPGGLVTPAAALSIGFDLIPGFATVPNNFHATGPVRIPRTLRDAIAPVVAVFDVPVERERRTALSPEDLPRVLIYALDTQLEAEFAGAASLRSQRIQVEIVDAVREGDSYDLVQDRVAALAERIRMALDANPTLSGATPGLMVEEGGEPRAGDLLRQAAEWRVLTVTAAYVT